MQKDPRQKPNTKRKMSDPSKVENSELTRIKKVTRKQFMLAIGTLAVVAVLLFAMTSAWYTNVSKVSGLKFKTESWGFDADKIVISAESISAAPGSTGIVPINIDNSEKNDKVKIYVTVSKKLMDYEMQKRIFFYADTSEVINGETVSKVYVGSTDDNYYEYTILPGQQLILSDDYHNDVPIKWQWVYDMEGYYFHGTVGDDSVTADEFLRPIEYDLDDAIFDITGNNATGKLESVGGVTAENFLRDLSQRDGYEGTIDVENAVTSGNRTFYPVDVDDNGTGVWAYLCTYGEIETGINYDTEISGDADITASLNITAVNMPVQPEKVADESGLKRAAADPDVDFIELTGDVEIGSVLRVTSGNDVTLDLNGFDVTYTGSETAYTMFQTRNGSTLTVIDGEISGNGNVSASEGSMSSIAFYSSCGDLTLSHVKVTGFDSAVYVADVNGGNYPDSTICIYGCEFDTHSSAVYVLGNGANSDAPTQVIISDSTIRSDYVGVCGNGSDDRWGIDTVIINSNVSGKYAALYQPQRQSSTVISGSVMTGITGIAVKGGTVTVIDSTISGTGPYSAARSSGSGWTDTGDGVYVEATYNWSASVSIKGDSVVTSENGYAVQMFGKDGTEYGRIVIYDGEFTAARGSAYWNSIGTFRIHGGTFNNSVSADITRFDD